MKKPADKQQRQADGTAAPSLPARLFYLTPICSLSVPIWLFFPNMRLGGGVEAGMSTNLLCFYTSYHRLSVYPRTQSREKPGEGWAPAWLCYALGLPPSSPEGQGLLDILSQPQSRAFRGFVGIFSCARAFLPEVYT